MFAATDLGITSLQGDYFTIVGMCFAYNRGSVRLKAVGDITPGDRWAELLVLNSNVDSPLCISTSTSVILRVA